MDHHPLTFVPIIRRTRASRPASSRSSTPPSTNREVIEVAVYQGECRNTRDNVHVGAFFVPLPPMPAGSPVQIGFEYDRNGLIRVSVSEKSGALKRYTMDLNRCATGNSEPALRRRAVTVDEGSEDGDGWPARPPGSSTSSSSVSSGGWPRAPKRPTPRSASCSRATEQLAAGDDERLDGLEEALYAWLDAGGEQEEEERLESL